MTLTSTHRDFLHGQAITDDVIETYGIRSVEPEDVPESIDRFFVTGDGILFEWRDVDRTVPQYRPDRPKRDDRGRAHKYVFPAGCGTFLGRLREPADEEQPYLLVEGTKQMYAAISWAPAEWGVNGIAGCNNWVGTDLSWAEGRRVVVLFDNDLKTNRDVYDAAVGLKSALEGMGADDVAFATLTNARSKEGLDDVLGRLPQDKRTKYLERMCKAAKGALGRAPKIKKAEHPLFDGGEFLAMKASEAVLDGQPAALGLGSTIALYRDGAFRLDFGKEPLFETLQKLLGEKYRPGWRTTVEESLIGILSGRNMRLPEHQTEPLLNCANGMLDLRTGELHPHSPDFLSSMQIPVAWDPDATADYYGQWVEDHCPGQVADLEESVSVMLDPSRTPSKAVFLFGVSRSGKSTFLNLLTGVAGPRNTSGVDLHQLADDRFAAANLYGMMLNSCADLSADHVRDTSLFKRVTGDDVVQANRKYGQQFAFTNRALFAFSANTLPTVSETSRAYVERIKPFHFPRTFAGREDPRVGDRLQSELPGILVRWVAAWQRLSARGHYGPSDPTVMHRFETSSNRVALWVSKAARVHPGAPGRVVGRDEGSGKQELYDAFRKWLEREGGAGAMKRSAFLESLESVAGVCEVRLRHRSKNLGLNVTERPESEIDQPDKPVIIVSKASQNGSSGVGSVGSEPSSPYVSLSTRNGMNGWGGEVSEVYAQGAPEATLPTPAGEGPAPIFTTDRADQDVADELSNTFHEPPRVVTFDVETPGKEHLLSWDVATQGPWARLCGYSVDGGEPVTTTDVDALLTALYSAEIISAHNGANYDLIGLARHHGADYERLVAKLEDTLIIARQLDPPSAKHGNDRTHYDLDSLGNRLGVGGKHGDLGALKAKYGDFHLIPTNDVDYRRYLEQDVRLLNNVRPFLPVSPYVKDEHEFIGICGGMTLRGVRVDVPLVTERAAAEEKQKRDALAELGATTGLPLERVTEKVTVKRKATGKGVGRKAECDAVVNGETSYTVRVTNHVDGGCPRSFGICECPCADVVKTIDLDDYVIERAEKREPFKSPLGTTEGMAWLEGIWEQYRVTNPPRTDNGRLSTKKDRLQKVIDHEKCPPDLARILDLMNTANGARVVYATVLKNMVHGRYHPRMSPDQASGRLSCGVSVFGKHGGKVRERGVFVADPGHLMVAFDYDQVDARAIAAHCQDPAYMSQFEGDLDFHTANAILVFGDASFRQLAKVVGHGENYGMGVPSLALNIVKATGMEYARAIEQAQAYVDAMARLYPKRNTWREGVRAQAKRGELLDNGFGRMMRPDASRSWTQGPALIGQGTTRDIMRKSILDLPAHVRRCLLFTVHDELVFQFPTDLVEEYAGIVMGAMTFEWAPTFLGPDARRIKITCGRSQAADSWAGCYGK
jgi:putative DNA primase/helicase